MHVDRDDVLAVLGAEPMSVGDVGLAVLRRAGVPMKDSAGVPMKDSAGVPVKDSAGVPMKDSAGVPVKDSAGVPVKDSAAGAAGVGQRLAAAGLSLSALQRLVDALVAEQAVQEVRGRELWDRGLPTAGTKAMGRYFLAAEP